ncbi:hypothetical protein H5410_019321 [Solanum commersonii]|uniref:Uncharacterized protein n=1 Tax=Solanum commersonii TaxID=4109 RepID=A0A9J5Z7Y3_SOLCO|nr:hypothetical protein H5410_019321 [Solanum commersonii]
MKQSTEFIGDPKFDVIFAKNLHGPSLYLSYGATTSPRLKGQFSRSNEPQSSWSPRPKRPIFKVIRSPEQYMGFIGDPKFSDVIFTKNLYGPLLRP